MSRIRGLAGGTTLTGALYEPNEEPRTFRSRPDIDAPYVWVCDEFYETESGGQTLIIDDREVQVPFESPMPRRFDDRGRAIDAATAYVRTQFARLGVPGSNVRFDVPEAVDDKSP